MSEGDGKVALPAPLALMNLPDVLGERTLGEAFPTELTLNRLTLSPGRFSCFVILSARTMVLLDVSVHITGGNHFFTLRTLALLSNPGVLGWQ